MAKYKIKDLATDFGMSSKEMSQIIEKFYEKPKSSSQSLEDDQLNVIFDYITQINQIPDISVVFAVAPAPKKEEPKAEAPKAEEKSNVGQELAPHPRLQKSPKSLQNPQSPSASVSAAWWTPLLSR